MKIKPIVARVIERGIRGGTLLVFLTSYSVSEPYLLGRDTLRPEPIREATGSGLKELRERISEDTVAFRAGLEEGSSLQDLIRNAETLLGDPAQEAVTPEKAQLLEQLIPWVEKKLREQEKVGLLRPTLQLIESAQSFKAGNTVFLPFEAADAVFITDLHGDRISFQQILTQVSYDPEANKKALRKKYLILGGDYVDGGPRSLDVLLKTLTLYLQDSKHVVLMGGNIDRYRLKTVEQDKYRFFLQLKERLGTNGEALYKKWQEFARQFLVADVITKNGFAFVHAAPPTDKVQGYDLERGLEWLSFSDEAKHEMATNSLRRPGLPNLSDGSDQENEQYSRDLQRDYEGHPSSRVTGIESIRKFGELTGASVILRGHDSGSPHDKALVVPVEGGKKITVLTVHASVIGSPESEKVYPKTPRCYAVVKLDHNYTTIDPTSTDPTEQIVYPVLPDAGLEESDEGPPPSAFWPEEHFERLSQRIAPYVTQTATVPFTSWDELKAYLKLHKAELEQRNHEALIASGQIKSTDPVTRFAYQTFVNAFSEGGWATGVGQNWQRAAGALDLSERIAPVIQFPNGQAFPTWEEVGNYLRDHKADLEQRNHEVLVVSGKKKATGLATPVSYQTFMQAFYEAGWVIETERQWMYGGAFDLADRIASAIQLPDGKPFENWNALREYLRANKTVFERKNYEAQVVSGQIDPQEQKTPTLLAYTTLVSAFQGGGWASLSQVLRRSAGALDLAQRLSPVVKLPDNKPFSTWEEVKAYFMADKSILEKQNREVLLATSPLKPKDRSVLLAYSTLLEAFREGGWVEIPEEEYIRWKRSSSSLSLGERLAPIVQLPDGQPFSNWEDLRSYLKAHKADLERRNYEVLSASGQVEAEDAPGPLSYTTLAYAFGEAGLFKGSDEAYWAAGALELSERLAPIVQLPNGQPIATWEDLKAYLKANKAKLERQNHEILVASGKVKPGVPVHPLSYNTLVNAFREAGWTPASTTYVNWVASAVDLAERIAPAVQLPNGQPFESWEALKAYLKANKSRLEERNHEVLVAAGQVKPTDPVGSLSYLTLVSAFQEGSWAVGVDYSWQRNAGGFDLSERLAAVVQLPNGQPFGSWKDLKEYFTANKVVLERRNHEMLVTSGQSKQEASPRSLAYGSLLLAFREAGWTGEEVKGWFWDAGSLDLAERLRPAIQLPGGQPFQTWESFKAYLLAHKAELEAHNQRVLAEFDPSELQEEVSGRLSFGTLVGAAIEAELVLGDQSWLRAAGALDLSERIATVVQLPSGKPFKTWEDLKDYLVAHKQELDRKNWEALVDLGQIKSINPIQPISYATLYQAFREAGWAIQVSQDWLRASAGLDLSQRLAPIVHLPDGQPFRTWGDLKVYLKPLKFALEQRNREALIGSGQMKTDSPNQALSYATLFQAFREAGWAVDVDQGWLRDSSSLDLADRLSPLVLQDEDQVPFSTWPELKAYLIAKKADLERQNTQALQTFEEPNETTVAGRLAYATLVAAFQEIGWTARVDVNWNRAAGALDLNERIEGFLALHPLPEQPDWPDVRQWYLENREGLAQANWQALNPETPRPADYYLAPATIGFALVEAGHLPETLRNGIHENGIELNYALNHQRTLISQLGAALDQLNPVNFPVGQEKEFVTAVKNWMHPELLLKVTSEVEQQDVNSLAAAFQAGNQTPAGAARVAGLTAARARKLWGYVTGAKTFVPVTYANNRAFPKLVTELVAVPYAQPVIAEWRSGLEETRISVLERSAISRLTAERGIFEWARSWAEVVRSLGGELYDGIINVTNPDQPALSKSFDLTRSLEADGHALVVPTLPAQEIKLVQSATLWVQKGVLVPAAWREFFQIRELAAEEPEQAGEALREARVGDVVLLNDEFVTETTQENWVNILNERELLGLRVPAGMNLETYSEKDLATLLIVLERSGIHFYDLSSLHAADIEGQRQLLLYL